MIPVAGDKPSKVPLVLEEWGFRSADSSSFGSVFEGTLDTSRGALEAQLVLRGPCRRPELFLTSNGLAALGRPIFPHVLPGPSGYVCVIEEAVSDQDVYDPAGELVTYLQAAVDLLGETSETVLQDEISRELITWFQTGGRIHLERVEEGFLTPCDLPEAVKRTVYTRSIDPTGFGYLVETKALSFGPGEGLPTTIATFCDWLRRWDADAADRVDAALKHASKPSEDFVLLCATPHGIVGLRLHPNALVPKELKIYASWPVSRLWSSKVVRGRRIELVNAKVANSGRLLERNGRQEGPLVGRQVVLVGAGAIGGHVAPLLVQNGAGYRGGELYIVDPDHLSIGNTLRHRLGLNDVGKSKAKALEVFLSVSHPFAQVGSAEASIGKVIHMVRDDAIVIDATGATVVREQLNWWRLERGSDTTLLHGWIEGNGDAVVSFINDAPKFACARCVRGANLADPPRFGVSTSPTEFDGTGCAGDVYAPYASQAATMAASLLVQHLVDWLAGGTPRLRNIQVNLANSRYRKPSSPPPLDDCPACRQFA